MVHLRNALRPDQYSLNMESVRSGVRLNLMRGKSQMATFLGARRSFIKGVETPLRRTLPNGTHADWLASFSSPIQVRPQHYLKEYDSHGQFAGTPRTLHRFHSQSTIMSTETWTRLIRFVDDNGRETFGEPWVKSEQELAERLAQNDLWAFEFKGETPVTAQTKGDKIHVKALRNLLKPSDVPIIRCIGLNYQKHSTLVQVTPRSRTRL